MLKTTIVIPARYGSTRFCGKPLAELWGKPIVQHVWERARQARLASRVIVATDDERIADAARSFGAEVAITRPDHPSGTDRVAEVARSLDSDLIVNVQGDEPLIDPGSVDAAILPLAEDPSVLMSTLCCPIEETADLVNPNVVKVVLDRQSFALYFSRLPIPFVRDQRADATRYRHLGIYAYRRDFLLSLAKMAPSPLEQAERLEQLRVLEHGYRIRVAVVERASPGVDTLADLEKLEEQGPR